MFKRLLIANRGEIAVRIIRACQELDIETVAIYSEADASALHVQLADFAYLIGPAEASQSYLNKQAIVEAAIDTKSEAIHPGYGFLSEDYEFAKIVAENGIAFVGPSSDTIFEVGDKGEARKAMVKAGLSMLEGTKLIDTVEEALVQADLIGYPVILKPVHSGGGRGMYIAVNSDELVASIEKYNSSFLAGTPFYFEKYLAEARHIEVQIIGDNYGHVVHLGERECSLQRRNQKILEEAPSSALTNKSRKVVGELAVRAAKSVHYVNAGTVEFLMDLEGNFHFMEINPRIQVEHGITEMITGIDLVKTQIQIADGQTLNLSQDDITFTGHAIECRINAEDTNNNFIPSPGQITFYHPPGGSNVRVDTGVCAGSVITMHYDSLIAKVLAYGKTRGDAINTMKRALKEFRVEGIETTIDFHRKLMIDPNFKMGKIDTQFINRKVLKD